MKWWFWSSKEETAEKNLQKYRTDLGELKNKTNALDKQVNTWIEEANSILDEAITKSSKIQIGMSTADDLHVGGTRKKRKNKKHKKKTYRH